MKSRELKPSAVGVFARRIDGGFAYQNSNGESCDLEGVTDKEKKRLKEEAEALAEAEAAKIAEAAKKP